MYLSLLIYVWQQAKCTFVAMVLIYAVIKFEEVYRFVFKTAKEVNHKFDHNAATHIPRFKENIFWSFYNWISYKFLIFMMKFSILHLSPQDIFNVSEEFRDPLPILKRRDEDKALILNDFLNKKSVQRWMHH